jgi:hypothetical protein
MTWQNSCGQDNNGHPIMRMLSLYVLISCVISATDLLDAAYEEQNKQETLKKGVCYDCYPQYKKVGRSNKYRTKD